jgi:sugar phosphate isomerase/epimerase
MLHLGLRAHDYGKLPPEQLADILAGYHPESIQLALPKALSGAPEPGALSPGYAREIRKIFEARRISIAVLGCYINPIHPDKAERERALRSFEAYLRYARDFGCALVGTETGSCNPDSSFHPDTEKEENFDLLCESIARLAKTAEKCGSIVGVEAVAGQHTISTIEKMEKLLARVDSPSIKVIWDPVNLIPLSGLNESQERFFARTFEAFGDHIAAVHIKDFRIEGGKKRGDLPIGSGELDWDALLSILIRKKPGVDILLENSDPVTARGTMAFLRETAARAARMQKHD